MVPKWKLNTLRLFRELLGADWTLNSIPSLPIPIVVRPRRGTKQFFIKIDQSYTNHKQWLLQITFELMNVIRGQRSKPRNACRILWSLCDHSQERLSVTKYLRNSKSRHHCCTSKSGRIFPGIFFNYVDRNFPENTLKMSHFAHRNTICRRPPRPIGR